MKHLMENPVLYHFLMHLIAPGHEYWIVKELRYVVRATGEEQGLRELDVGCGPWSYLWRVGRHPLGLDLSHDYNLSFVESGGLPAVTGSVTALPFRTGVFDRVWNFGLMHHLSEGEARRALEEMAGVVRPGGKLIVFDGVMPASFWHHPLMWVIRKLDRGRFVRRRGDLEALFFDRPRWRVRSFRYSLWGHEGVFCIYEKPE